ncbi:hypothetical protein DM02DRAFT_694391 [Periconia macrospinosa]|uniref:F-box domain-containing protein n=1 Tax=Periconia macrospinosa TaxID=97972 RepID=A0A2V1D8T8_9PLEO|nr:hypothetical protein DM02DRAFT_694391 [Periconia macrospinosa]
MTSLQSLPTELLLKIMEHLTNTDPDTLFKVSLTSRKLHHIAQPLVYQHICFSLSCKKPENQLLSPWSKFIRGSHPRDLTTSLTLHNFSAEQPTDLSQLNPLYNLISSFQNLKTISLHLYQHFSMDKTRLPQIIVCRLLQSLPPTVENLELDTNGYEAFPDDNAHICPQIRRVLPQLAVLRLRVSTLCFWSKLEESREQEHEDSDAGGYMNLALVFVRTTGAAQVVEKRTGRQHGTHLPYYQFTSGWWQ